MTTVQGWAAREVRALRDELTVVRMNDAAAWATTRAAEERAPPAASTPGPTDDGEVTNALDPAPPMYAARQPTIAPPAALVHPDLIGCEDVADEAARPTLGPDEKTPPRRGRAAVLAPVFHDYDERGAA